MDKDLAICFSGQPRCIDRAFDDFQRLFDGLEFDIFAHIWDSEELLSSWGHGMGWENRKQKIFRASDFVELFKPTDYIIDKYDATEFYKHNAPNLGYGNPVNKVWSSYSQFFSIKKSFEVKKSFEIKNNKNYKYVVKYRMDFDVDFDFSSLSTKELILDNWKRTFERLDNNPNLFLTNPGWDWPNGNGVSNLLAVGDNKVMDEYSRLFDFFPELHKECEFRDWDEAILKRYLDKKCQFEVGDCGIHVGVYR